MIALLHVWNLLSETVDISASQQKLPAATKHNNAAAWKELIELQTNDIKHKKENKQIIHM